jgi:hypothetical protein
MKERKIMKEKNTMAKINNQLLKSIEEDDILNGLIDAVKLATENASTMRQKADLREAQLIDKLEDYSYYSNPINSYDINEVENAVNNIESRENIERKIIAIRRLKQRPWTSEKNYRETMAQYFTYITPIFSDIEKEKQDIRNKRYLIQERYLKEIGEIDREFNEYEDKVKELLEVAGEYGPYMYQIQYEKQFSRIARSDDFTKARADEYNRVIVSEYKEPQQKIITSHETIDGIEKIFAARP